jgi:catechol-2,3-dioxygenase
VAVVVSPYGISSPAIRLPDSTHVGGVHLQVSDLRVSVAYYEQVIGLRVLDEANDVGPWSREARIDRW